MKYVKFLGACNNSGALKIRFNSKRGFQNSKIWITFIIQGVSAGIELKTCFLRQSWTKYCKEILEIRRNRFSHERLQRWLPAILSSTVKTFMFGSRHNTFLYIQSFYRLSMNFQSSYDPNFKVFKQLEGNF